MSATMDGEEAVPTAATEVVADESMMEVEVEKEQKQEQKQEPEQSAVIAEEEQKPARKPRKPKRRAMDAHFWGMSEAEIASIKASLAAQDNDEADNSTKDATKVKQEEQEEPQQQQQQQQQEVVEEEEEEEDIPEGRLPKAEILSRRRVLHTDWRFAAFSQFAQCFPHLCVKEFKIELLEKDLEGSDPGSYVGEVISRLLYHLTKDSSLAGKSPDKPWLIRLRREFLRRDPTHNSLGDGPLYVGSMDEYYDEEDGEQEGNDTIFKNEKSFNVANASMLDDQSAAASPQPVVPTAHANISGTNPAAPPVEANNLTNDSQTESMTDTKKEEGADQSMAIDGEAPQSTDLLPSLNTDDKPWLAEFPNSKGWEDLTIQEQIYALWAVTEWHLTNADKFRNILNKYRIDGEQPFWRIEPIGYDKDYNNYWMFDDFRLWIERQTPLRKQQLQLIEEVAERAKAREIARQKRIRREQRQRMRALHERRRLRNAAKRAAEEELEREMLEMDERDRLRAEEQAAARASNKKAGKAKGKRKRGAVEAEEEEEEEPVAAVEDDDGDADFGAEDESMQGSRISSRISRARQADRALIRPDRRRSTRNSSSMNLSLGFPNGDEEWQQLPPEWMKSEEDERDDDPDFGADQAAVGGLESESELSGVDDDTVGAGGTTSRRPRRGAGAGAAAAAPIRASERRRSPRKQREKPNPKARKEEESDLSELSDVDGMSLDGGEEDEDEEIPEDIPEPIGHYPDSAWESYRAVPSFDDEDKDAPEGFVRWELVLRDLEEWPDFGDRIFPGTEDEKELSMIAWVEENVVPRAKSLLADKREAQRKINAAKKAAEKKAKADLQTQLQLRMHELTPPVMSTSHANSKYRSSRIAQKEAKEAEEKMKAYEEEKKRLIQEAEAEAAAQAAAKAAAEAAAALAATMPNAAKEENSAAAIATPQVDPKIVERDRRAARAREREEAKKAKDEADVLAAVNGIENRTDAVTGQAEQQVLSMEPNTLSAPMVSMANGVTSAAPPQTQGDGTAAVAKATAKKRPKSAALEKNAPPDASASVPASAAAPIVATETEPVVEEAVEAVEPAEEYDGADDYFLDCSVCKKRGVNLDPNSKLVACDNCDRWEHVVCHRKAAEKAGLPKRDFDNEDFLCEDCEDLEDSVILPSAPKRERSDKQKAGAKKGAEKRKAKAAAARAKKTAATGGPAPAKPAKPAKPVNTSTASTSKPTTPGLSHPSNKSSPAGAGASGSNVSPATGLNGSGNASSAAPSGQTHTNVTAGTVQAPFNKVLSPVQARSSLSSTPQPGNFMPQNYQMSTQQSPPYNSYSNGAPQMTHAAPMSGFNFPTPPSQITPAMSPQQQQQQYRTQLPQQQHHPYHQSQSTQQQHQFQLQQQPFAQAAGYNVAAPSNGVTYSQMSMPSTQYTPSSSNGNMIPQIYQQYTSSGPQQGFVQPSFQYQQASMTGQVQPQLPQNGYTISNPYQGSPSAS